MSTGRPGRHGNAAPCLVAEVSSHDAEPARTATTVPGVVRYVTQTIALTCTMFVPSLSPAVHCLGTELKSFDVMSSQC